MQVPEFPRPFNSDDLKNGKLNVVRFYSLSSITAQRGLSAIKLAVDRCSSVYDIPEASSNLELNPLYGKKLHMVGDGEYYQRASLQRFPTHPLFWLHPKKRF